MSTPDSITLLSPAKLNLFLHITGRRADGYHNLQTLFQLLNYGDTITFERRDDQEITLSPVMPEVPFYENLIVRAARLLQSYCSTDVGVDIQLEKRLPMGGGIGGGSSNAATTLVALNYLWECGLTLMELHALGLNWARTFRYLSEPEPPGPRVSVSVCRQLKCRRNGSLSCVRIAMFLPLKFFPTKI